MSTARDTIQQASDPPGRTDGCLCDFDYRSLGKLYGIAMGKGLVRITTHPRCPAHALCRHFTKQVRAEKRNGKYLYCNVHAAKDCPA